MITEANSFNRIFDIEKTTDIELAMRLLQLMNDDVELKNIQGHANEKNIIVGMTESAIETMTNPFAKKLLKDKITELGRPSI